MLINSPLVAEGRTEAEQVPPLIGPNAVLQLAHVMEAQIGTSRTMKVMRKAGMASLPSGLEMIPEEYAVRLHHALAMCEPDDALALARASGSRTADYIMANRIPAPIRWLLRHLPAPLSGRMLMAAIRRHAWTFTGAGEFTHDGPWYFSINRSKAHDWVEPPASLFAWYEAVFERLFSELTAPDCICRDISSGGPATHVHHYRIARAANR